MAKENLLEIYYDRVATSEEIILTEENCEQYGYIATTTTLDGIDGVLVFYKEGTSEEEFIQPTSKDEEGNYITTIIYETYQRYSHIAPPCSSYKPSFADVDKEGSGRNSLTGEMFRERIGSYSMLTLTWDLIPNSKEYNNWYRILTHLPPYFYAKLLSPNGEIVEKKMYRGDVETDLYLFVEDGQMWKGLSTTFTQWDIDPYDDTLEPTLEVV